MIAHVWREAVAHVARRGEAITPGLRTNRRLRLVVVI